MSNDTDKEKAQALFTSYCTHGFYWKNMCSTCLAQSLSTARAEGRAQGACGVKEQCAKVIERRAEDRTHEHGSYDPSTNVWECSSELNSLNEEDDDCAAICRTLPTVECGHKPESK